MHQITFYFDYDEANAEEPITQPAFVSVLQREARQINAELAHVNGYQGWGIGVQMGKEDSDGTT